MKCKLCLEEKKLQKSHIIPEFLYNPLYDPKHRLVMVTPFKSGKNLIKQKGIYEELLCFDCEQHINKFENYALNVFSEKTSAIIERQKNYYIIKGIDYFKFKLFQLSILWRASISKNEFFSKVNLGKHENILRIMIFNQNPGKYHDYGCCTVLHIGEDNEIFNEIIMSPCKFRSNDGHISYSFLFAGVFWIYIVSKHSAYYLYKELFFQDDGSLKIVLRPDRELIHHIALGIRESSKISGVDETISYWKPKTFED